eukprot:4481288-Amphidinium_carterae.2
MSFGRILLAIGTECNPTVPIQWSVIRATQSGQKPLKSKMPADPYKLNTYATLSFAILPKRALLCGCILHALLQSNAPELNSELYGCEAFLLLKTRAFTMT